MLVVSLIVRQSADRIMEGYFMKGNNHHITRTLFASMLIVVLATLLLRTSVADAATMQQCGKWSVIPSPSGPPPFGSQLNAVAVISTKDVWAVGFNLPGNSSITTLIEHWNGKKWKVVVSPNPGSTGNELYGVTAISANNVWAAGYYNLNDGVAYTLIEHWDGKKWSVVSSPNTDIYDQLYNVTAISANDIWAVGISQDSNNDVNTLTEHWDGTQWSVVPSANPQGSTGNGLSGVAASSAKNVWTVGIYSSNRDLHQTLTEFYC